MAPSVIIFVDPHDENEDEDKGTTVSLLPTLTPQNVTSWFLTTLKFCYKLDRRCPYLSFRALSGLLYEADPVVQKNAIAAWRQRIPEIYADNYSVIYVDAAKVSNIAETMEFCFNEADQPDLYGPRVILIENMESLFPKSSADEEQREVDVQKFVEMATEAFRKKFVLFFGFATNLGNLNPALVESQCFNEQKSLCET